MLKTKIIILLFFTIFSLIALGGCNDGETSASVKDMMHADSSVEAYTKIDADIELETTPSAIKTVNIQATVITLKNDTADISGSGATFSNGDIVITSGGSYVISGTLTDGRIIVNAPKKNVTVILNGASVTSKSSSAFYVYSADNVILTAYDGSINILSDGESYKYNDSYSSSADEEPDAALYCKSDLILNGEGKLVVAANFKNGLTGKDDLVIENLTLTVSAVNHGITGRDSAVFNSATVTVAAGGDGIRANNDEDAQKGTVALNNSCMTLISGEDGIQAETTLTVQSGVYEINCGGGSEKTPTADISAKGFKSGTITDISGGTITVDSSDDAIHSNGNVLISNGKLILSSGDDGIHADDTMEISGGTISVNKSYEGLEATDITVTGGDIFLVAEDDGVNICGGDGSANMGRPGMDNFGASSGGVLKINGGSMFVNALGDGLDANGSIEITGGTVLVDGPANNGNGSLDYDNSCTISGGLFIAIGSSGMAQTPSSVSEQNSLVFITNGGQDGDVISLKDDSGRELCSYTSKKSYSWVCISSAEIATNKTYTLYANDSELDSLTVSGSITSNTGSGGFGGQGGMGGHGGFGGGMGGHGFAP